jgi:hypothetical protein
MRSDMAKANGKHEKKKDLPDRAQTCRNLFYISLLSANQLFELVEAIRRAIH